ncbi:MAG: hypothetical protein HDQ88_04965 [Clostridia bacterium]|nr:hypothetical protein [Clostridia bacterium]
MIGSRLKPIQISKLYHDIINYINGRRKEPKTYKYKTKYQGVKTFTKYDDVQLWCKDFPLFVKDEADFKMIIEDIADSQSMTVANAMSKFDREIYLPCLGVFTIRDGVYHVLKEHNFDIDETLRIDHREFRRQKLDYYAGVREGRFTRIKDKARYYEHCTKRFTDILRRREA